MKLITPPKDVRRKSHEFSNCLSESQVDKGDELLNCEGEEIQLVEQNQELDKISDEDPISIEPAALSTEYNNGADMRSSHQSI